MYHESVLLDECVEALSIKSHGTYVDLTFGGGGHSKEILKKIESGHLYGFDQDKDAFENAKELDKNRFTFTTANFRCYKKYLRLYGVNKVDGVLADLGVSSYQINEGIRGFSTRFDGPLDMRMNQDQHMSAAMVVNEYQEKTLQKVFKNYSEVRNAKALASRIVAHRARNKIETIAEFKKTIESFVPKRKESKYLAQVFQGLRIEVNEELKALEEMLEQSIEVIKPGGRIVIISYHSLEDRLVKNFLNSGNFKGEIEKDLFGNHIKPFEPMNKKVIVPCSNELQRNRRSRSAKLRVGVKRCMKEE